MNERRTVRVVVRGQVQGVGFRAWTMHHAEQRGLDGWVRNRLDGSVEAVFAGPAEAVAAMVERCRRGPRSGRVDDLQVTEEPDGTEPGFTLRETA